jgi:hypothetical protein
MRLDRYISGGKQIVKNLRGFQGVPFKQTSPDGGNKPVAAQAPSGDQRKRIEYR